MTITQHTAKQVNRYGLEVLKPVTPELQEFCSALGRKELTPELERALRAIGIDLVKV